MSLPTKPIGRAPPPPTKPHQYTVMRLANTAGGEPYKMEVLTGTQEFATAAASRWWGSGGTVAVLVINDKGKEDARYTREYARPDRVPKAWPNAKTDTRVQTAEIAKAAAPLLGEAKPKPSNPGEERPAPTLGDEDDAEPDDLTPAAQVSGEPPMTTKANAAVPGACLCCFRVIPDGGYPDEGRDRSPSGRISDQRCPLCGSPQATSTRLQIMQAYAAYQRRLGHMHHAKHKPWNPR